MSVTAMLTSFSEILAMHPPTLESKAHLEMISSKSSHLGGRCRDLSALVWATRHAGDEWTRRYACKAVKMLMQHYRSDIMAAAKLDQAYTAIAASLHLLLALCGTTNEDGPKDAAGKKRARNRTAQAPTGLGNAFVAVTDLFMHWDQPHEAEPVRHVEDVVQLLSKTAATVCHATAGLGQSLGEDVLRSLSSISMAALAVKDQRWQLPSASDQLVTSLLEHGQIHITRQLLQRLDTCAPVVATALRTALQLRLQGAMSAEENSKPNERASCTIVAILNAAQLEHDMPSLLLVATPNLVQCCAEHKSAAVRKAACTCIRVMVQYACRLMAANETKQVEQILHWSAAGLAKRLAQDRDCTVRIHACHEVRDVLSRTARDGVCRSEVAHRLLMHLGRAAAGTGNKRVLVAASKDLTVLADAQQAAHINDSEDWILALLEALVHSAIGIAFASGRAISSADRKELMDPVWRSALRLSSDINRCVPGLADAAQACLLQAVTSSAQEVLASGSDIAQHLLTSMNDSSCPVTRKLWEAVLGKDCLACNWSGDHLNSSHQGKSSRLQKLCPDDIRRVIVKNAWRKLGDAVTGLQNQSSAGTSRAIRCMEQLCCFHSSNTGTGVPLDLILAAVEKAATRQMQAYGEDEDAASQQQLDLATRGILLLMHAGTAEEKRLTCLHLLRHLRVFLPPCNNQAGYQLNQAVLDMLMCQPSSTDVTSKFTAMMKVLRSIDVPPSSAHDRLCRLLLACGTARFMYGRVKTLMRQMQQSGDTAEEAAGDVVQQIMHSLELDTILSKVVDVAMGAMADSVPLLLRRQTLEAAMKLAQYSPPHSRSFMIKCRDRILNRLSHSGHTRDTTPWQELALCTQTASQLAVSCPLDATDTGLVQASVACIAWILAHEQSGEQGKQATTSSPDRGSPCRHEETNLVVDGAIQAAGSSLLELTQNKGLKLQLLGPALRSALHCTATRKAALSATLIRLADSSKLQVSAFLLSLIFGGVDCTDPGRGDGHVAHVAELHQQASKSETAPGCVLDTALCIDSILPTLINMGMVDQQFSWPLLRVLTAPVSCSAQQEAAACLLAHFNASSEQAKLAAAFMETIADAKLSKRAQAHIRKFVQGHLARAGYKLRLRCQATQDTTKKHKQDHGQGSPGPSDNITDAAYERAVAQLNSHSRWEMA